MAARSFPIPSRLPATARRLEPPAYARASPASGRLRIIRIRMDRSERCRRERDFVFAAQPRSRGLRPRRVQLHAGGTRGVSRGSAAPRLLSRDFEYGFEVL